MFMAVRLHLDVKRGYAISLRFACRQNAGAALMWALAWARLPLP